MLPRVAWTLAGITTVVMVADVLLTAQAVSLMSETSVAVHGFPFVHGAVIGSALTGALIVARYDRHLIGWLLSLVGVASSISLLTESYAYWVQEADGPGPSGLAGASAWISSLLGGQLAIAGMALLFLLAPDGRLLSRRWRYAAWVTGFGALLCLLAVLSMDPTTYRLYLDGEDFGLVRNLMLSVGILTISGGLVASVVSMVLRLRRSRGEERQQLRLIALSAALLAVGICTLLVVQTANGGEQSWLAGLPLFIAYSLVPILFATAILRHRLYDLDVIINRTVVLVAGTAFAALGYTTLVVIVGQQVEGRTGGFWLSLLATAVVALAFQPLRRSVVRLANRLAYGNRAQPYEALADFSRHLAESPSPDTLLPAVAEAAGRAVSARGAIATLDAPDVGAVSATWGTMDGPPDHRATVSDDGIDLGSITVLLPKGRGLRPADARLLQAVADQTAVAFRNTALAAQLAAHVAQLDRTTHELGDSRRRLLEADDAARRNLEIAIAKRVLPYLAALRDEIRQARQAVVDGSADNGIDRLVESTNSALEALRHLTHGVFPTQLARSGLEPALRSLLARSGLDTVLTVNGAAGLRFPSRIEAALYFCCVDAARTGSQISQVELSLSGHDLTLRITGTHGPAVDLQSITDRVEAVGGTLSTAENLLMLTVGAGDQEGG